MKKNIYFSRRGIVVVLAVSLGLCLYLILMNRLEIKVRAHKAATYQWKPSVLLMLARAMAISIFGRAMLAYSRRLHYKGPLQINVHGIVAFFVFVIVAVWNTFISYDFLFLNQTFWTFLFFSVLCVVQRKEIKVE